MTLDSNGVCTINHNCNFTDTNYKFLCTAHDISKIGVILRTYKVDGNSVRLMIRSVANGSLVLVGGDTYTLDWIAIK